MWHSVETVRGCLRREVTWGRTLLGSSSPSTFTSPASYWSSWAPVSSSLKPRVTLVLLTLKSWVYECVWSWLALEAVCYSAHWRRRWACTLCWLCWVPKGHICLIPAVCESLNVLPQLHPPGSWTCAPDRCLYPSRLFYVPQILLCCSCWSSETLHDSWFSKWKEDLVPHLVVSC